MTIKTTLTIVSAIALASCASRGGLGGVTQDDTVRSGAAGAAAGAVAGEVLTGDPLAGAAIGGAAAAGAEALNEDDDEYDPYDDEDVYEDDDGILD